jgi:hypothetical protein
LPDEFGQLIVDDRNHSSHQAAASDDSRTFWQHASEA